MLTSEKFVLIIFSSPPISQRLTLVKPAVVFQFCSKILSEPHSWLVYRPLYEFLVSGSWTKESFLKKVHRSKNFNTQISAVPEALLWNEDLKSNTTVSLMWDFPRKEKWEKLISVKANRFHAVVRDVKMCYPRRNRVCQWFPSHFWYLLFSFKEQTYRNLEYIFYTIKKQKNLVIVTSS